MRDCLYAITWTGAIGENYTFDENGEVVGLSNVVVEVLPVAERTEENQGYKVPRQRADGVRATAYCVCGGFADRPWIAAV